MYYVTCKMDQRRNLCRATIQKQAATTGRVGRESMKEDLKGKY